MACGITAIAKSTCGSRRRVAGIKQRMYLGLRSDITSYTETVDGAGITDITFVATKGLKRVYGKKRPGGGNQELQSGTNKFFNQTLSFAIEEDSPTIIAALTDMLGVDDVVAIVEQRGGQFKLYGKEDGLEITTLTKSDGVEDGDDMNYIIELTGTEIELAPVVFDTDYTTTLALLEGYVTV